jgi:ABC-type multidrug transport system fused ATPase/permease subunit
MNPPKLINAGRRPIAVLLIAIAVAQGMAAAGSAEAIRMLLDAPAQSVLMPILIVATLALTAGAAVMGERWIGERLAQSFVSDTREMLFDAVIRQGTSGREARWLTPLVSDLAALRNWAARGPVRLITASLAGIAATVWFAIAWPQFVAALLPMVAGLGVIVVTSRHLTCVIARQRLARGALTRFLIRRVRAEVTGVTSPKGHGRKALAERSAQLCENAEQRAFVAGCMEAVAVASGGLSGLALVLAALGEPSPEKSGLIAGLALIAFIATRLLELARAIHAHAGGKVALRRIATLLRDPDPLRTPNSCPKQNP